MRRTPCKSFAFIIALASLAACGAPESLTFNAEPTATATEALKTTANQKVSGDSSRSATTATLAITTLGKGTAVAGYASKPSGAPTAAWSFSPDAGVTWSEHRSDEQGDFQWPAAPVNDGPFAYYGDAPTMIALDAFPGVVVAVVSAYGTHAAAVDAVALVSTDGGAHFKNPTLITTESYADKPGAAPVLEYLTAGPVVGTSGGAGAGVWALYRDHQVWFMRKLAYDAASQSMKIAGADARIPVKIEEDSGKESRYPVGPSSIVAAIDATGDEIVHVAWASYDNRLDTCPIVPANLAKIIVEWGYASAYWSPAVGIVGDWQPKHSLGYDDFWPRCIGAGTRLFKNTVRPVIAVDPVSQSVWTAYVTGSFTDGSQINVDRTSTVTNNTFGQYVLFSTLTDTGDPLPGVHDQWAPTLAILHAPGGALPTIAVTWRDTRDDPASPGTHTSLWGGFSHAETMNPIEPLAFSVGRITPLSLGPQAVPWALTDFWGRYDGIAADPTTGDFMVAWADNRGGGKTQVWTSRIAP